MSEFTQIKSQIIDVCQRLSQRQLVANHDGNVSVRVAESQFETTPTSFAKCDVSEKDLLTINIDGQVLSGLHKVFSEWSWHKSIYQALPEVTSVVHAHPPHVMALAFSGVMFDVPSVPEAVVSLGAPIKTLPLLLKSEDIMLSVQEALSASHVFIVEGNGAFAVGDDSLSAYLRLELLEHVAKIYWLHLQLGERKALPYSLIETLLPKRPKLQGMWQKNISAAAVAENKQDQDLLDAIKKIVIEQMK